MTLTLSISKFDDSRVTLAGDITGDITEDERGPVREKIVNPTACESPSEKRPRLAPKLMSLSKIIPSHPVTSHFVAEDVLFYKLREEADPGRLKRSSSTDQASGEAMAGEEALI